MAGLPSKLLNFRNKGWHSLRSIISKVDGLVQERGDLGKPLKAYWARLRGVCSHSAPCQPVRFSQQIILQVSDQRAGRCFTKTYYLRDRPCNPGKQDLLQASVLLLRTSPQEDGESGCNQSTDNPRYHDSECKQQQRWKRPRDLEGHLGGGQSMLTSLSRKLTRKGVSKIKSLKSLLFHFVLFLIKMLMLQDLVII